MENKQVKVAVKSVKPEGKRVCMEFVVTGGISSCKFKKFKTLANPKSMYSVMGNLRFLEKSYKEEYGEMPLVYEYRIISINEV